MNKNTVLLVLAVVLIVIGLGKPNLSDYWPTPNNNVTDVTNITVSPPTDSVLLDKATVVKNIIGNGPSSRHYDGKRLASLYIDVGTLIGLKGSDEVLRNTEEIRQANSLAGSMLKLNIKDKYPELAKAAEDLVVSYIGGDDILLDDTTRNKAVEAFNALAWACYEGSK